MECSSRDDQQHPVGRLPREEKAASPKGFREAVHWVDSSYQGSQRICKITELLKASRCSYRKHLSAKVSLMLIYDCNKDWVGWLVEVSLRGGRQQ